jgi:HAD superfamily hydrolase (TIGR01509 family)
MRTEEWAQYIHGKLRVNIETGEIAERVVHKVVERISTHVPVLKGADGALERLAAAFRLGLATSATLVVAQTVLAKTGWNRYFPVIVSADAVPHGKPAPDVYLRALQLLIADPARTAAVEDSANGIRSAHAARLPAVAIPNRAFPPDAGALALAARVLSDLDEVQADTIRDILHAH